MFRQDRAWTRSLRIQPKIVLPRQSQKNVEFKETEKSTVKLLGSFESELAKTHEWMNAATLERGARIYEKEMRFDASSEKSRPFGRFFPTYTPSFLGDVIKDSDLDDILESLMKDLEEEDQTTDSLHGYTSDHTSVSISTTSASETNESLVKKKRKSKKKKRKPKLPDETPKSLPIREFWVQIDIDSRLKALDVMQEISSKLNYKIHNIIR